MTGKVGIFGIIAVVNVQFEMLSVLELIIDQKRFLEHWVQVVLNRFSPEIENGNGLTITHSPQFSDIFCSVSNDELRTYVFLFACKAHNFKV